MSRSLKHHPAGEYHSGRGRIKRRDWFIKARRKERREFKQCSDYHFARYLLAHRKWRHRTYWEPRLYVATHPHFMRK